MNTLQTVTITIDDVEVEVPSDCTVLEALRLHGTDAPVICFHEATTPRGICRQCVVEIQGWRVLAPACVTHISDGMVILSESERVQRARRTILEMLDSSVDISETPDIREQFAMYEAEPDRFPGTKKRTYVILDDNPFYIRDYEKCIMCWRCVQACGDDLQFSYALSLGGRGYHSTITTFFEAPMPETTCVFCGNCVAVCPSNALRGKTEFYLEQGLDYDQIRLEKKKSRMNHNKGHLSDD